MPRPEPPPHAVPSTEQQQNRRMYNLWQRCQPSSRKWLVELYTSREVAAEFTFFLAIPVMFGASLYKLLKFILKGAVIASSEWIILVVGLLTAFIVSIIAIKFLMSYIKKNDFKAFGVYRIVLGILVLIAMFVGIIK